MSTTEDTVRTMLADQSLVRAFLAKTGRTMEAASDALPHIHHAGLPAPAARGEYTAAELAGYRPYLIVYEAAYGVHRTSTTGWQVGGEMVVEFFEDVPDDDLDDLAGSYVAMRDAVKAILGAMAAASVATAGYLPIERYAIERGPYRFELDEEPAQGCAQWCVASVVYGEGDR